MKNLFNSLKSDKISIISLSWNSGSDVASQFRLLTNSIQNKNSAKLTYHCFDNSSAISDSQIARVEIENHDNQIPAFYYQFPENYGYAKGNDLAIRTVLDKFPDTNILIVNPDITLHYAHLQKLLRTAHRHPNCVLSFSATNERSSTLYNSIRLKGLDQEYKTSPEDHDISDTDYIPGSFIFFPNQICGLILSRRENFFKHDYFLYWEEVELSLRLRKIGVALKLIKCPPIVRHSNSNETNTNAVYYFIRNSFKIQSDHPDKITPINLLHFLIRHLFIFSLKSARERNTQIILNYFFGLADGLSNVAGKNPRSKPLEANRQLK